MYIQIQIIFCQIFLLFIYCKRAGWKYSPTDGKVGTGFKDEGRRTAGGVVEVIQAQEWDRTGAQNEQVAHQQERSQRREALPCSTEPGSMIGFTPLTIQFRIWWRGYTNPWTVLRTNVYHGDKWFRVVKKGEKVKGPVVVSSTPAAVLCKSTMAESVLYTDGAARAEAGGLRHGKHSSLPKRVAASHSLRQQQMRHTHTHKL